MKTIKEAASDYVWESGENHPQSCFIAGAQFAQQWISVDDELPEEYTTVLVRYSYEFKDEYFYCIACYCNGHWKDSYLSHCLCCGINRISITHWRAIELE
jgi:hypothetical protein